MAFVWGIHRNRWIPRTKGQLRGKCFHFMASSCYERNDNFVKRYGSLVSYYSSIDISFNQSVFYWSFVVTCEQCIIVVLFQPVVHMGVYRK